MAENDIFLTQLKEALNKKSEWFDTVRLPEIQGQYRILQTCTKNLYETLIKKSLIIPDPYRMDKKIQEIQIPDNSSFSSNESQSVLGDRFSTYEAMLDFICTYYRFTVESLSISKCKKLVDLNATFEWDNLTPSHPKSNTRALAEILAQSKNNTPGVIISMITDSCEKNASAVTQINQGLKELGNFQKELYKAELRTDLFEHPEFNKEKAFSSADAELEEIKRVYPKVMGKKPFYTDLIKEIIQEDQAPNKAILQQTLLKSLEIKAAPKQKKVVKEDNNHELIMGAVAALCAISPTLSQLKVKLTFNFDLVFKNKKNFFAKLISQLRKAFHLKEPPRICSITMNDPKTGAVRLEKIKVDEFLVEMTKKERGYASIATRGSEYDKIDNSNDEVILNFVNKQISECQSLFTKLNSLDSYFKGAIDIIQQSKVKGMQIELSALRNSIINVNKKRGDYVSSIEEAAQMKKLGITELNDE